MNNLNEFIANEIKNIVKSSNVSTTYRTPLVCFGDAQNPLFNDLKNFIDEDHYLPSDLLENGKTVVSFFIPFSEDIAYGNIKNDITTKEWAYAKKDTEGVIDEIIAEMKIKLSDIGINVSNNPSKAPYTSDNFIHKWSQRHVGYICGLGNFGLNHLLITESGCAGRYGSFVIDAKTDYNSVVSEEYCLYKVDKSCGACVKNCPSGALNYDGIDKVKCSSSMDVINEKYYDGIKALKSCGKCIALPCALKRPTKK